MSNYAKEIKERIDNLKVDLSKQEYIDKVDHANFLFSYACMSMFKALKMAGFSRDEAWELLKEHSERLWGNK